MSERKDIAELSFEDRIERIQESRRMCYTQEPSLVDCLPRLHRDCFWLLDIVEKVLKEVDDEQAFHDAIAACKMKYATESHILDEN